MELSASDINKYSKYSLSQLHKKAKEVFHKYIRERDRDGDYFFCPTCGKTKKIEGKMFQACHVFPAGHYPELEFDENNVFGGCLQCNYYKHGTNYIYNDWCRNKIGEEAYQKLLDTISYWKRNTFRRDRFDYIQIILKYK